MVYNTQEEALRAITAADMALLGVEKANKRVIDSVMEIIPQHIFIICKEEGVFEKWASNKKYQICIDYLNANCKFPGIELFS